MAGEPSGDLPVKPDDVPVVVRTIGIEDLDSIVGLHRRAFPDSVLARLGTDALRGYYRWQIAGPHEVAAVGVWGDGRLLGLLLGGRFRGSMIGFVKHEWVHLGGCLVRHPAIVFGPRGRAALATGVRLLLLPTSRTTVERPERVPDQSFGVLVIAVDPDAQRDGLGRLLLSWAENEAAQAGFERLHLTIDPTNWGAAAFYRELGWERLNVPGDAERAWLIGKELGSR